MFHLALSLPLPSSLPLSVFLMVLCARYDLFKYFSLRVPSRVSGELLKARTRGRKLDTATDQVGHRDQYTAA